MFGMKLGKKSMIPLMPMTKKMSASAKRVMSKKSSVKKSPTMKRGCDGR